MDTPNDTTLKQCAKCGEWKPRDHFHAHKGSKDGLVARCKPCACENTRNWRKANLERAREKARLSRQANLEQRREADRVYYKANREKRLEYINQWREDNPDYARNYSRLYRKENPDKVRDTKLRIYEQNAEEIREYQRNYRREHADKIRRYRKNNVDKSHINCHRRRARIAGNGGNCTAADLAAIRAAQTDKAGRLICWHCGKPIKGKPDLDHWIPLKHGGPSDAVNMHYMHARCNRSKGAKMPTEIGRLL